MLDYFDRHVIHTIAIYRCLQYQGKINDFICGIKLISSEIGFTVNNESLQFSWVQFAMQF